MHGVKQPLDLDKSAQVKLATHHLQGTDQFEITCTILCTFYFFSHLADLWNRRMLNIRIVFFFLVVFIFLNKGNYII